MKKKKNNYLSCTLSFRLPDQKPLLSGIKRALRTHAVYYTNMLQNHRKKDQTYAVYYTYCYGHTSIQTFTV